MSLEEKYCFPQFELDESNFTCIYMALYFVIYTLRAVKIILKTNLLAKYSLGINFPI